MGQFFYHTLAGQIILMLLETLAVLVPLLIAVAYLTLMERKVMAAMQRRRGPNVNGPFGLLQAFADAIKMIVKETIIPAGANRALFLFAPFLTFSLAMVAWAVIPTGNGLAVANINVGILYLLAISSLGVYGILIAGWASNSKYAFLGAARSIITLFRLNGNGLCRACRFTKLAGNTAFFPIRVTTQCVLSPKTRR